MTARFRIRTSQGQELSFASREVFEDFVRSGELAPDDLVYDGETNEWAPARTHPLVLQIEYEDEADEGGSAAGAPPVGAADASDGVAVGDGTPARDAGAEGDAPAEGDDPGASAADFDLGLELAPAQELTPEEQSRAFVERLEMERARERELYGEPADLEGVRIEGSTTFADMLAPKAPPPPRQTPPPAQKAPGGDAPGGRSGHQPSRRPAEDRARPRPEAGRPGPRAVKPKPSRASARKSGKPGGATKLLLLVAILAAIGAVAYYWLVPLLSAAVTSPSEPATREMVAEPTSASPTPPAVPSPSDPPQDRERPPTAADGAVPLDEQAARARARERSVVAARLTVDDLGPVPDAWLTPEYFVLPSDHAGVRAYWLDVADRVSALRAGGADRYADAYRGALDEAGVRDETERDERTRRAVAADSGRLAEVDRHWALVEALAEAAVQSHDALVGAEGLVLPDSESRRELGGGVRGRDAETQLLLDQVTELLEEALAGEGRGPGAVADVREWFWSGYLDAAAGTGSASGEQ